QDRGGLPERVMRRLALVLACSVAAGAGSCDPRLYNQEEQRREQRAEERRRDEEQPSPRPPALNPLAALGALGAAQQPGPFDEPLRSPAVKEGAPYAAILDLRGRVVEI